MSLKWQRALYRNKPSTIKIQATPRYRAMLNIFYAIELGQAFLYQSNYGKSPTNRSKQKQAYAVQ